MRLYMNDGSASGWKKPQEDAYDLCWWAFKPE